MCTVEMNIPEAVLYDTHMDRDKAMEFVKRTVAAELYVSKGVSIGYCSEIAGMSEEDFIKYLGERRISVFRFEDEKEFDEELANA